MGNGPRTLKTVTMACSVLKTLKEREEVGVTELAEHLEISKGAAYNHLATLKQNQLVEKVDGRYRLSPTFINYGQFVKNRHQLYRAGREQTNDLAAETGEYAHLMIEKYGRGIYLHKARGEQGIAEEFHLQKSESPDLLHLSSTGKAILAHLPDDRVSEIIDQHGLLGRTKQTLTTPDELWDELEEIRDQGFALNDQEEVRGTRAVGAPIFGQSSRILGAISISGPSSRLPDEQFYDQLPEVVMKHANLIEVRLETEPSHPLQS